MLSFTFSLSCAQAHVHIQAKKCVNTYLCTFMSKIMCVYVSVIISEF